MYRRKTRLGVTGFALLAGLAVAAAPASAQQRPAGYGEDITVDAAKKIAAGAMANAMENNLNLAVAVVDNHGFLVYFERMADTQTASVDIAIDKAKTAAMFRRPSRVFEEAVAKGRVAVMALRGATTVTGGLPIMIGGKVAGGVGVSGAASNQDEAAAAAGLALLK